MKRSGNISLFRVAVFLVSSLVVHQPILYALIVVYLVLSNIHEALLYALLLAISLTVDKRIDFIPFGIVDYVKGDYAIVDKLLYRIKVLDSSLSPGDVVAAFGKSDSVTLNDLKNSICFKADNGKQIFRLFTRYLPYRAIESADNDVKSLYHQMFYGFYDEYAKFYSFSIGLSGYYGIRTLIRRNAKAGLFFLIAYGLFFPLDSRMTLVLVDILLRKMNRKDRLSIKLMLVSLLNYHMLLNNRMIFIFALSFIAMIDSSFSFKFQLAFLESLMFGSYDIISILAFRYLIYARLSLFVLGLIALPFSGMQMLLIKYASALDWFFDLISLEIRGKASIYTLVLFLLARKLVPFKMDLLLLSCLLLLPFNDPFGSVVFIDVGQGDAALINCPLSMCHILIDTGSSYNYSKLKRNLFGHGIYRLDYVVITHDDSDHNGSYNQLLEDFAVENVISEPRDVVFGRCVLKSIDLGDFDNDNDNSLVYYLDYHGLHFLFTGDISANVEALLVKRYHNLHVDVLKVSHHGSKTATSSILVSTYLPRYSIISTSGQYGHPHKETLETLKRYGSNVYITSQKGDVTFYLASVIKLLKTANGEFVIMRS